MQSLLLNCDMGVECNWTFFVAVNPDTLFLFNFDFLIFCFDYMEFKAIFNSINVRILKDY